ncbi:putative ribonuclease H-like domain-containing protein [Tanacetum coccineum]
MRPFGCPVTILNTIDHLGKFDGKADEGFFVGYSTNSKAFRVFNSGTRIVEEKLVQKHRLQNEQVKLEWKPTRFKPSVEEEKKDAEDPGNEDGNLSKEGESVDQEQDANVNNTNNINTVSQTVNAVGLKDNVVDKNIVYGWADINNLDTYFQVSHVPTTRIHKDHPLNQVIGDLQSATQKRQVTKNLEEYGFVSTILKPRTSHKDLQNCLFACFLSQEEPKKVVQALKDPSWIEAMQEELLQFKNKKDERGIVIKNKVEKALYGLHQAPRAWYETLLTYLLDNGFQRGKIDKTLFIRRDKGDILLVQVYVDDIIFGSTKKSLCTEFEKMMHKKFQMSSMGELTFFLGLQVKQKEDGIFISQDKYVTEILKKFSFSDVKTASTPMETHKPLLKDADGEDVDEHLYRSMIRSLMYLTSSRPDIMFAVCACARFQVNPKSLHLHAVKRIFRYLKGQPKLGLWYPKDSPFDLVAYTDSDYARASLDRKSTTGGCQFLGCRLISWQCKKQTVVSNSITEAEYVAASSCYGQVLWIQNQLLDYGYNFMHTKIYIDNESIICIVKNPVFHSKTKHIEIRHHFIIDSNEKKLIQMIKIHTD